MACWHLEFLEVPQSYFIRLAATSRNFLITPFLPFVLLASVPAVVSKYIIGTDIVGVLPWGA